MATTKKFTRFSSRSGIYYCRSITDYTGTISPAYRTITQIHTACEIFYLQNGKVTYVIEGDKYEVTKGEMVLVPPGTHHYTIVDTSESYERIALEYSPELLPQLADFDLLSAFKNSKLFFYTIPAAKVLEFSLEKHLKSVEHATQSKAEFRDVDIVKKIMDLSKALTLATEDLSVANDTPKPNEKRKISQLCISYIKKNVEKNITVETIAETLHISPSHILHQFKKEIGMTIHQYIIQQKIKTATTLLEQGISPADVSVRLGYDYYSTFYNCYLKIIGVPPSETYKKANTKREKNIIKIERVEESENP